MNNIEIRGQAKLFLDAAPFRVSLNMELERISYEALETKLYLNNTQELTAQDLKNHFLVNSDYELQIQCRDIDWPLSVLRAKLLSLSLDNQQKAYFKFKIPQMQSEIRSLIDEIQNK